MGTFSSKAVAGRNHPEIYKIQEKAAVVVVLDSGKDVVVLDTGKDGSRRCVVSSGDGISGRAVGWNVQGH